MKALMAFITKRFWLLWCGKNYWTASKVYEDALLNDVYVYAIWRLMRCDCRLWGCDCRLLGCDCRKWISGLYLLIRCKHFENVMPSQQNRGVLYDDAIVKLNPRLTFYDTRKKIWIRGVDYEIAAAITNPLKTITGPRKKMKMLKIDLKKVPSPKFFFARLCRYNGPTFYEKNISLHNPFKMTLVKVVLYVMCIYCVFCIGK